ncbi:unnamed protein product [Angiostrongylus costaricensis]|uniref:TDP43_N domain-containing protein n=1 Tax=Angiostrongylus costaricensis TaxID=334426 RepID=A0A0R3PJY3_ANGCS|nr:unnamed protein product [Angiostrongylus costaricensis]
MYYRSRDVDCRNAVKFDGKRFLPPGGAWSDRRYYVTIGQRCHSFSQPFGSYENASKQFERSVTAVQKLLGSSLFGDFPDQRPQDSVRKLSPIEQQFADLAKISTGKDVIIEQQRGEIRRTNDLLQKVCATQRLGDSAIHFDQSLVRFRALGLSSLRSTRDRQIATSLVSEDKHTELTYR